MTKNCEKGRETRGRRAAGCRAPGPPSASAPAPPRVLRRQGLTGAPGPGARKPGDRRRGDGSLPRRRSPVQRAGLRVVRRPAQPGPGRPGGRLEHLVSLTRSRRHADAVSATARHSDFQVLGVALTFPSASAPPASQRHLPPARPVGPRARSPCHPGRCHRSWTAPLALVRAQGSSLRSSGHLSCRPRVAALGAGPGPSAPAVTPGAWRPCGPWPPRGTCGTRCQLGPQTAFGTTRIPRERKVGSQAVLGCAFLIGVSPLNIFYVNLEAS